jgi:hypothetical protein
MNETDNRPAFWFVVFVIASAVMLVAVSCKAVEAMQGF